MENKRPKLILIDGNAIIHRSFHALPPLSTKEGELVNAVYGFAATLLSVIDKFQPEYIVATFDLAAPTFRHAEYAEYKATRTKAPDELYQQIDRVKELVCAFNIPIYEKEGFEADDVIGTLVRQSEDMKDERENIIVTGDLDALQLVTEKTKVFALRRGISDTVLYDAEAVKGRFGLAPEQMIDYKGLRGDVSDNIPGVKGIGEKTATSLLQKYGTLEKVYENLEEIKGATKDKLEKERAQAQKSKWLATIVKNVPVELDLEAARTQTFERARLVKLFQELNFFSLIKRIPGSKDTASDESCAAKKVQDFKFDRIEVSDFSEFEKNIFAQKEASFALRFQGEKLKNPVLQGVAISYKTGRASYVEWQEKNLIFLRKFFEDEKIKKITYDWKMALEILHSQKIEPKNIFWDVLLSAYLLNPGGKTELSNLVLENLGEEVETSSEKGQLGLGIESTEEIFQKECRKADYFFKLKNIHEKKIQEIATEQKKKLTANYQNLNLENIFHVLEMPLISILAKMEEQGVRLNTLIFSGISEKIAQRLKNLEKNIYALAKEEFNINSPKQVGEILFEKLKISTINIKKLKTGYATASAELEKLKGKHKIIEKIEEYREIFKLKTTYLDTLPTMVDKESRIHSTFNQAVTATGRLSSSEPNLQNIPTRTDLGQLLRVAFEAQEGYKLVAADYSQIDLRVAAHMSEDKNMIEAFTQGEDIHRATAAIVNKITPSQVSEKMRSKAKALNFGIIYGMSVFGFASSAGIDREEARTFIDEYMRKFSGVAEYMHKTKEAAKKNLFVETELGRRRNIPEINSPNFQVQNAAERMAINMPIQGLSADIVKLAMLAAEELMREYPEGTVRMVLQVHDELIFEVKEDLAQEFSQKIKIAMENAYKLKVPLAVNVKIGDNWGEV